MIIIINNNYCMLPFTQEILEFKTRSFFNNSMNGTIIKIKSGNEVNLEKD